MGTNEPTVKIERRVENGRTVICLVGRLQMDRLPELASLIRGAEGQAVLDLEEVTLVDVEVVRFLQACEARGVLIERCAPYIRAWMLREQPK